MLLWLYICGFSAMEMIPQSAFSFFFFTDPPATELFKAVWISKWPQMLFTTSSQKSSVLNMLFAQSGLVPKLYC